MAGLLRDQTHHHGRAIGGGRFAAAVLAVKTLLGLAALDKQVKRAGGQVQKGVPILAKYLRTLDVDKATGRDMRRYPGYCSGAQETERRLKRAHFGRTA